jgi:uncharacterized protein with PQ loop repeat
MSNRLETLMSVASVAQSIVPLISLTAYVPQWVKLIRTKESRSISMVSWMIWAVCYGIGVFYSVVLLNVTGRGWPLVAATSLGLSFVLFTMVLVWRYRER